MLEFNRIYQSDCLELMKSIDDNSIDAIITDPPYELGFMAKSWDSTGIANNVEVWQQALRILKPGGYLLSFGGTRTYHRMACAIEDAGFEIRDMIEWIYGSGFPKSLNIGKAIDKLQGNEREVTGTQIRSEGRAFAEGSSGFAKGEIKLTKGNSEFEGWGTALKPAHEPICMARKPLAEKTVAENVLKYGTGGINIDECRINVADDELNKRETPSISINSIWNNKYKRGATLTQGRFPANLIHDGSDVVMAEFEKYGVLKSGGMSGKRYINKTSKENWNVNFGADIGKETGINISDSGTPARFFYCAKASKSERDMGCEGLEEKSRFTENKVSSGMTSQTRCKKCGFIIREDRKEFRPKSVCWCEEPEPYIQQTKNFHPTVKPIKLMEYLIKLVTTEKAIVLDPFAGSGSTLIACRNLGRSYIGIEKEIDYVEIANKRIEDFTRQLVLA